ncbi:hypothetical protein SAMN05414137_12341 [Streptacidiphilus jiangxiensis]|uniref:Uncharacterized protein n=1 Tax=Streptacidiphilus jiangxiensis TaxID=235985 RepID=A0A1H7X996_STRJI|nr:hypothetical protein SAMN05414137_12341 [Streptacidiphilus jiangxiensis]
MEEPVAAGGAVAVEEETAQRAERHIITGDLAQPHPARPGVQHAVPCSQRRAGPPLRTRKGDRQAREVAAALVIAW